ncbi:MAG: PH domain-containing protein, partial [Nocardioidaceae bacterium]
MTHPRHAEAAGYSPGGSMGISPKLLSEGEHVIVSTRTHWKALIVPVIALIVVCAVAGFVIAVLPDGSAHAVLVWIAVVIALALIGWLSLWPFLTWLMASYTVTNRRLINRSGVLVRKGRDIPLQRINDVRYERGIMDRLLGCGTLIISDASDEGRSVLPDVPHVER